MHQVEMRNRLFDAGAELAESRQPTERASGNRPRKPVSIVVKQVSAQARPLPSVAPCLVRRVPKR